MLHNQRKPTCSNKDPAQPKILKKEKKRSHHIKGWDFS